MLAALSRLLARLRGRESCVCGGDRWHIDNSSLAIRCARCGRAWRA